MSNKKGLKENSLQFLLSDTGLDEILSDKKDGSPFLEKTEHAEKPTSNQNKEFQHIGIDKIFPCPLQPRRIFNQDKINELAESIKSQGILQPLVLRHAKHNPEEFEIIAGERRWRAAAIAKLKQVPAVIRDISDDAALASALIENIQREDLNPLEEARALERLIMEFSLTQAQVAETVGKSRTTVTNLLRLLSLIAPVQNMLESGDIDMGHARALLSLDEAEQLRLAKWVVATNASVRETEQVVQRCLSPQDKKDKHTDEERDADLERLENDLSLKLATQVKIAHSRSGKGQLIIKYHNTEELDGILKRIK